MPQADNPLPPKMIFQIALAFYLAWGAIFSYQCLIWLQTAVWQSIIIWDGFRWLGLGPHPNSSGWLGVDEIVTWAINLPLSLIPFLIGTFWLLIAAMALTVERENQRWTEAIRGNREKGN